MHTSEFSMCTCACMSERMFDMCTYQTGICLMCTYQTVDAGRHMHKTVCKLGVICLI